MSAADSAQQAARLTDPVGHSSGLLGMIVGAIVGAVVGAILIAGAIATGGALLIALSVAAAGACVAGGGLAGGQLARGIQTAAGLSYPTSGVITAMGSPNVRIGNLFAARAMQDMAAPCNGYWFSPFTHGPMAIAEGAKTVRINNLPAARVTSKLTCGAEITKGHSTVIIGGAGVRVLEVDDLEETLQTGLTYLLYGSLAAAFLLTIPFGAAAVAEFLAVGAAFIGGFEILGAIGDQIGPGWRDILQGAFGLGTVVVGGARGRARMSKAPPGGELPPNSTIIEEGPGYKVYETADGQQRIRFKADEARTLQHANPGRNYTTETRAGLNTDGEPFVYEGRHRAIGAAKGDTVSPDNGGVPDAPGYLDYKYNPTRTTEKGVLVRDLSIDYTQPDVPASEADKIWDQRHNPPPSSPSSP